MSSSMRRGDEVDIHGSLFTAVDVDIATNCSLSEILLELKHLYVSVFVLALTIPCFICFLQMTFLSFSVFRL